MERRFYYNEKDITNFIKEVQGIDGVEWRFFYSSNRCTGGEIPELLNYEFCSSYGELGLDERELGVFVESEKKILLPPYPSLGLRFEEAQFYFIPFASTPNFPVAIIKRGVQSYNDLYVVGINIDSQMAEAEKFGQKGKQEALQQLEDVLRKLPHVCLPQAPQPI